MQMNKKEKTGLNGWLKKQTCKEKYKKINRKEQRQAWAELGQGQVKLEVIVEVGVEDR